MSLLDKLDSKRVKRFSEPGILSRVTRFVSTGCLPLDLVMGGGIPVGRVTEVYGDTSTGKSLLGLHILAETQAAGGIAALFDTETASSEEILKAVGIDLDSLAYYTPETIEEVYEDLLDLLEAKRKNLPDEVMVVVWDSIAATSADKELEDIAKKGLGAATMGIHARLMSQLCRVLPRTISRDKVALVVLNQTRQKLGVLFGDDEVTFGGKAIGFYSSVRLRMRYVGKIKAPGKDIAGIKVKITVVKNKIAPPFGEVEIPILFGSGVDEAGAILSWMHDRDLLKISGGWKKLSLNGEEYKFQSDSDWREIYGQWKDAIDDLVINDYEN